MGLNKLIQEKRREILEIAARHGAYNVRLFGSVARGEADEASDVDILVELEPNRSLLDLGGFLADLEDLLECKKSPPGFDNRMQMSYIFSSGGAIAYPKPRPVAPRSRR